MNISRYFNASGTSDCFTSVLSGEDVIAAKPSPEIFHKSLEILGVMATEALVIEDSEQGITAAQHAGIRVFGVKGLQ
jgi:HAD superfamily hydrolase (TIGR01509 family)